MEQCYWCSHCFRFCGVTKEADIFICCSECGKVLADRISLQLAAAERKEKKKKKKAGKSNEVSSQSGGDGGGDRFWDESMMSGAG